MSWLKSLFGVKQKPSIPPTPQQWRVMRLVVHGDPCDKCHKTLQHNEYMWQAPDGQLVRHVDCETPTQYDEVKAYEQFKILNGQQQTSSP